MRQKVLRVGGFRHPMDNPAVKAVFAGHPKQYKEQRFAYPHEVLKERDPIFRKNWEKIKRDYAEGRITAKQSEKLFFREVASSLARRRANYH